jgi:hypothetical protein
MDGDCSMRMTERRVWHSTVWMALAMLAAASAAFAQQSASTPAPTQREVRPLAPNRPGYADSSDVVGAGAIQLEVGFGREIDGPSGSHAYATTFPQPQLRIGLTDAFEVAVGGSGWTRVTADDVTGATSGLSDLTVGARLRIADESRAGIMVALSGGVSLPTGADGISSERYEPMAQLAWSKNLPAGLSLSGGFNLQSLCDAEDSRYLERGVSVSAGQAFSHGWGSFAEVFGVFSGSHADGTDYSAAAGVLKNVGDNIQFDAWVQRGLSDAATDWVVGVGFVIRRFR